MKRLTTELLLEQLCTDLGFCLPPAECARLLALPPTGVRDFTNAILAAEGMDPELADKHLSRQVRDRIARHFQRLEAGGTD